MKRRKIQVDSLSFILKSRALIHDPSYETEKKLYRFIYRCLINYKDFPKKRNEHGEITIMFFQSKIIIKTKESWKDLDLLPNLTQVIKIFKKKNPLWEVTQDYYEFLELETPKLYTDIPSMLTFSW